MTTPNKLLNGFGMQSSRVLLSEKHLHVLSLTEQDMGVIIHALDVLTIAFSAEHDYKRVIITALDKISHELNHGEASKV